MDRCDFCDAPAVQRLWLRRWPVQAGRRRAAGVRDVRVALCAEHLAAHVHRRRLLVRGPWAYG